MSVHPQEGCGLWVVRGGEGGALRRVSALAPLGRMAHPRRIQRSLRLGRRRRRRRLRGVRVYVKG